MSPKFSQTLFFWPDVHQGEEGGSRSPSQAQASRPTIPPPQDLGVQNMVRWLCHGRQWGGTHLKWPSLKCTQSSGGDTPRPISWPEPSAIQMAAPWEALLSRAGRWRRSSGGPDRYGLSKAKLSHTTHWHFFFSLSLSERGFCEASVSRR